MPTFVKPKKLVAAAAVLLAVAALYVNSSASRRVAAQPAQKKGNRPEDLWQQQKDFWKEKKHTYQEASECMRCHIAPSKQSVAKGAFEACLLTEYAIWKTYDKHAQAYAVLKGPRGQKIAKLLGKAGEPIDVLKVNAGCINCHAMNDLSETNKQIAGGKGLDPLDGVSCGGCHGPSSAWIGPHADKMQWRNKLDAKAKADLGFRDLRDPVIRAELCMSCHVGNARDGRVVTHAMMAAGHPPLPPIELATFSKNLPQHWREPKDTPAFKNKKDVKFQQTRFALVGNVVAVRETLKLVRDRADFKTAKPEWVWPELLLSKDWKKPVPAEELQKEAPGRWPELAMAHSDCFACHHDLKYPGFRQQRGFGYLVPGLPIHRVSPGRPLVRSWPLAALAAAVNYTGKNEKKLKRELERQLRALATATSRRPFGHPQQIAGAADGIIKWCDTLIAELRKADYDEPKARRLLVALCSLFEAKDKSGKPVVIPDYETARDVASLILTIAGDLNLKGEKVDKLLKALDSELDLRPYSKRGARVKIILNIIRAAANVPPNAVKQFDEDAETFSKYLTQIGNTDFLLKTVLKNDYDNSFLKRLEKNVSNADFNKGLIEKLKLEKDPNGLQGLSDQEERAVLQAVADYNPAKFRRHLKALKEIVNKK